MITKVLEIRDAATCIPALAIKAEATNPIEDKYLWRYGYPRDGSAVVLMHLSSHEANVDPYHWTYARTMRAAHLWILKHWDELKDGDVVDVRVTSFGEATRPAAPEIWTGEAA
jgi:hypothetical protein